MWLPLRTKLRNLLMPDNGNLLEVAELCKYFPIKQGFLRRVVGYTKAVDDVSFQVAAGETLGIVGESGCGKTTLGRTILRLYDPTAGAIRFHLDDRTLAVENLASDEKKLFRRRAQMIFQDPFASLNPRMNILETVGEPLRVNGVASGSELEERVARIIQQVGLRVEHLRRYPHSFSGGQRQRIGIARALVVNPRLVVADEPVSALDVSIQAQILNLLQELQVEFDLTYLFVSHDMSVIRYICDRIAVMYAGRLVELGPKEDLLDRPRHPYSAMLLAAVPRTAKGARGKRLITAGEPPDPANLPPGCVFQARCKHVQDICRTEPPPAVNLSDRHFALCHFADELELEGISMAPITLEA